MNIMTISFEEPIVLSVAGEQIKIVVFKTQEHGNVKFGIEAPRSVNVHREEIYFAIKQKKEQQLAE